MKAILFDAGNTLVWLDGPWILALLREHGVEATEHGLLEAQYRAKEVLDEQVRTGQAGDDAAKGRVLFTAVFRALGMDEAAMPAAARRLWARHAERNLYCRVPEGTAEALDELRRRGYRLGVISNSDGRIEALLDEVGLRGRFDFVLDSHVVGVEKPDPRIFLRGCEEAGVAPAEAAYVGDVYEIDVAGARAVGMRPFLVDPLSRWAGLDCERIAALPELLDHLPGAA